MKKAIGTLLYALIVLGVYSILPAPAARACDYRCGLDACRGTGREGYVRRVQFENYSILLEDELCIGTGSQVLYIYCEEFPCGAMQAGTLFTVNGSMVYAFKIRNEQEGEEVIGSIGKRGIENTLTKYSGASMPASQFENYHLALDKIRKGE